ncbi:MAG: iron-siderophore ABC transporter substrate-binding protein [Cyanobacteria bacterium P01_H01_bin.58]
MMKTWEKVLPMKQSFRRLASLFITGLLTVALISACARAADRNAQSLETSKNCRVVQHIVGETCIPLDPKRIIVLGGDDTLGNLLALGMKPVAASSGWDAVESFPKHLQNQLEGVEYVGSTTQPSLEKILLLQPDLILSNHHMEAFNDQLSQIAPTVVVDSDHDPWKQQLLTLSKILDKEDIANRLIDNYQQRIDELKQALGDDRTNLVVSVATATQRFGIWAYGSKGPVGNVLDDVGVQRPPSQVGDFDYTERISLESLDAIDGDVLLLVSWRNESDNNAISEMQKSPLWQQLEVVRNDQVYTVSMDHWDTDHSIFGINALLDDLFEYLAN